LLYQQVAHIVVALPIAWQNQEELQDNGCDRSPWVSYQYQNKVS